MKKVTKNLETFKELNKFFMYFVTIGLPYRHTLQLRHIGL